MMEIKPSPVQQIHDPLFVKKGVEVFVKREDLCHPVVSGNKWRKLKYNLKEAKKKGFSKLLTFGGAYSNHIYAVAGVGKAVGLETIGVIRGEETLPLNPTLSYARSCGMKLHYLSRPEYRLKNSPDIMQSLQNEFGEFYLLPEGGTNKLAIKGCEEIICELASPYDYYCLPVGTGGTMAGVVNALSGQAQVIGFSALKGDFLKTEVENLIFSYSGRHFENWQINHEYHFGGYAKVKTELFRFMEAFEQKQGILLEPVYTAKSLYGLYDLIQKDFFARNGKILFIHTGGLQGRKGFGL